MKILREKGFGDSIKKSQNLLSTSSNMDVCVCVSVSSVDHLQPFLCQINTDEKKANLKYTVLCN